MAILATKEGRGLQMLLQHYLFVNFDLCEL